LGVTREGLIRLPSAGNLGTIQEDEHEDQKEEQAPDHDSKIKEKTFQHGGDPLLES